MRKPRTSKKPRKIKQEVLLDPVTVELTQRAAHKLNVSVSGFIRASVENELNRLERDQAGNADIPRSQILDLLEVLLKRHSEEGEHSREAEYLAGAASSLKTLLGIVQ